MSNQTSPHTNVQSPNAGVQSPNAGVQSPNAVGRPGSTNSTSSVNNKPTTTVQEEEEVIDIDLDDPEVQAAANMIQAKFKGKFKGKFGMKKKPAAQPEVTEPVTSPINTRMSSPASSTKDVTSSRGPDKDTRVTSAKSSSRSLVTSPAPSSTSHNVQVDDPSISQLIHVDEILDKSVIDDITPNDGVELGDGTGLWVPTIGLIPSTPRPESPASSIMSPITVPAANINVMSVVDHATVCDHYCAPSY